MTYNPNAQQVYHPNVQQRPLRTYRVNYVSGLPQMPNLVTKITMYLYPYGFLFSGKRFPNLWIPLQHCDGF